MTFVDVYKIETWNTILQQGFNKQKKHKIFIQIPSL